MTRINRMFGLPMPQSLVESSSPLLITDDKVGVEIELEDLGLSIEQLRGIADSRWDVVEDGSLRNDGAEFVFKEPMYGTDVVETLTSLPAMFEAEGIHPVASRRCSVHVHLDVRDLEFDRLLTLIVVYLLCEPYFFAVAGEGRSNNPYSMALGKSTEYLNTLGMALEVGTEEMAQRVFLNHINSNLKYCAFNVAPVYTQGSIEFRHHCGTYDTPTLINWINMVLCMKRYTLQLGDMTMTPEFIDELVNTRYDDFINDVFRGVDVPRNVDGWEAAARVAKRVVVRTRGLNESPVLSGAECGKNSLFRRTQRRVGLTKMGMSDMRTSEDEVAVPTPISQDDMLRHLRALHQTAPSSRPRVRDQVFPTWSDNTTPTRGVR